MAVYCYLLRDLHRFFGVLGLSGRIIIIFYGDDDACCYSIAGGAFLGAGYLCFFPLLSVAGGDRRLPDLVARGSPCNSDVPSSPSCLEAFRHAFRISRISHDSSSTTPTLFRRLEAIAAKRKIWLDYGIEPFADKVETDTYAIFHPARAESRRLAENHACRRATCRRNRRSRSGPHRRRLASVLVRVASAAFDPAIWRSRTARPYPR